MAPDPLDLHSSRLRLAAAYVGPTALVILPIGGMVRNDRISVIPLVVLAFGLALGAVSALDYPRSSRFGPEGIARRCLLRVGWLSWSRVDALTRSADMWAVSRMDVQGSSVRHRPSSRPRRGAPGGLVAIRGHRRYLLVGQVESRAEFDHLVQGLAEWAPSVTVLAEPPPEDIAPTTIFRRPR